MGLQASPYEDILIPLYIIPHLMFFFKCFCGCVKCLTGVGGMKRWKNGDVFAANAISVLAIKIF